MATALPVRRTPASLAPTPLLAQQQEDADQNHRRAMVRRGRSGHQSQGSSARTPVHRRPAAPPPARWYRPSTPVKHQTPPRLVRPNPVPGQQIRHHRSWSERLPAARPPTAAAETTPTQSHSWHPAITNLRRPLQADRSSSPARMNYPANSAKLRQKQRPVRVRLQVVANPPQEHPACAPQRQVPQSERSRRCHRAARHQRRRTVGQHLCQRRAAYPSRHGPLPGRPGRDC
jgi:hypothetical protein